MAKTTRLKVKTPLKKKGVTKAEKKKPPKSKDNGALSRLTSLEDESGGVKLSLYGVSGTGKTRFIATWPKPILVIDCNCGVKSIRDIKNIDRIVPIDPEDLSELCEVQARENRWKTIVLDHASSFQDLVLGKVLGLEETPVQLGWGTATQQQWGTVAAGMKEKLKQLLDLADTTGCNSLVIAQQREFVPDEGSELVMPYVSSALSPSVVGYLGPAVDYICQTYIRQKIVEKKIAGKMVKKKTMDMEYCLRTGPHPIYSTKFRVTKDVKLPVTIVDPTYDKIKGLIS